MRARKGKSNNSEATDNQSIVSSERKYWELKWELIKQYLIE